VEEHFRQPGQALAWIVHARVQIGAQGPRQADEYLFALPEDILTVPATAGPKALSTVRSRTVRQTFVETSKGYLAMEWSPVASDFVGRDGLALVIWSAAFHFAAWLAAAGQRPSGKAAIGSTGYGRIADSCSRRCGESFALSLDRLWSGGAGWRA